MSARLKWLLGVLLVTGGFALLIWPSARRHLLTQLALRTDAPSQRLLAELADRSPDPLDFLERLWHTGKIVQRQFVVDHLKSRTSREDPSWPRAEQLLTEAALDADAAVRELALGALATQQSTNLMPLAQRQLRDPDPQLRLLGLDYLAQGEPAPGVPLAIAMLDDPDLRVVTRAEGALRRWTGEDFGVRLRQAIPQADSQGREVLDPAQVEAIREGVSRRRQWWQAHAQAYPAPVVHALAAKPPVPRPPLADFALRNLSDEWVRLSDFRGKVVLLNFWTTWCTACLKELPDLVELQRRHPDRLAVLGISLDGVPDVHGHGHDPAHHEDSDHPRDDGEATTLHPSPNKPPRAILRARIDRVVRRAGIPYPILLDPKNRVGAAFLGGELPTNVLIDSGGRLRRRFIGARALAAWEAMLAEAAAPLPETQKE